MRFLFELYGTFFKIGILTFGGGLTMLPMLKYEIAEKKKWTTEDELLAPAYLRPKFMAVAVAPVNIKPRQKTIRRTEPS